MKRVRDRVCERVERWRGGGSNLLYVRCAAAAAAASSRAVDETTTAVYAFTVLNNYYCTRNNMCNNTLPLYAPPPYYYCSVRERDPVNNIIPSSGSIVRGRKRADPRVRQKGFWQKLYDSNLSPPPLSLSILRQCPCTPAHMITYPIAIRGGARVLTRFLGKSNLACQTLK